MVTIADIALACKVSKTTVSRVLKGDENFSVSDQTRELILSTASSMNYDMTRIRSSAVKGRVSTARSVLPAASVLKVGLLNHSLMIYDTAKVNDYYTILTGNIMSAFSEIMPETNIEYRNLTTDTYEELDGLDVLLVIGKIHFDSENPYIQAIRHIICVDYQSPNNRFDSVCADFSQIISLATNHLESLGHTDICFIGAYDYIRQYAKNEIIQTLDVRHKSFIDYCLKKKLDAETHIYIADHFLPDLGYQKTLELLDSGHKPTAILYASDELALGGYKALQERGVTIGKEISVIGIDNMPFSRYLSPALTTIDLNTTQMGQATVYALSSQLEGRSFPLTLHQTAELISNDSCQKIH